MKASRLFATAAQIAMALENIEEAKSAAERGLDLATAAYIRSAMVHLAEASESLLKAQHGQDGER